MSQSETERAKHPAKVLTVTVDAVLDHSSAVILRPVPDSLVKVGVPEGPDEGPRARTVQGSRVRGTFGLSNLRTFVRTLGPSDPRTFGPSDLDYASTRMTTRRFWARPSRVLFGAIGFSSP
jgi:hypothetical protein